MDQCSLQEAQKQIEKSKDKLQMVLLKNAPVFGRAETKPRSLTGKTKMICY